MKIVPTQEADGQLHRKFRAKRVVESRFSAALHTSKWTHDATECRKLIPATTLQAQICHENCFTKAKAFFA